MKRKPKYDIDKIKELSDGIRKSREIAAAVGCPVKYVQKMWLKFDLPRPKQGPPSGKCNPSFRCGRKIDRDGYVLISCPPGHPFARYRKSRSFGMILEHRKVMEDHLERYLEPQEVVDHVDGCTLHNDLSNLRVYSTNREHLSETTSGIEKDFSRDGYLKLKIFRDQRKDLSDICRYSQMKKAGDARLLKILHAHLLLDKDSPYLLGTHRYLTDRQIDYSCRDSLAQATFGLCRKWELHQKLLKLKNLL